MSLLGVGRKDRQGRQVRIEHRGRYVRASRTGGVSLRHQVRAGHFGLAANTRHGVRLSMRAARNTHVAMQNDRFVLRGRYGSGPFRFNLSKSGLSMSGKTGIGTLNLTNPGRSSAKIGGIQLRGRRATEFNVIFLIFQALLMMAKLAVWILLAIVKISVLGAIWAYASVGDATMNWKHRRNEQQRTEELLRLERLAREWMREKKEEVERLSSDLCLVFLFHLIVEQMDQQDADLQTRQLLDMLSLDRRQEVDQLHKTVRSMVTRWQAEHLEQTDGEAMLIYFVALAIKFREQTNPAIWPEVLLALDDACMDSSPKTEGQEILLELLADLLGIRLIECEEESSFQQTESGSTPNPGMRPLSALLER